MMGLQNYEQRLDDRGILCATDYGWEGFRYKSNLGWRFPLRRYDGSYWLTDRPPLPVPHHLPPAPNIGGRVWRWKHYNSAGVPKYVWLNGKPEGCDYYFAADIRPVSRTGKLIIACGEVDMMSFFAAGKYNVTSFFGERNAPKTLVADLMDWGVTDVYYYPDVDHAGWDAAEMLGELLYDTPIRFHPYALPNKRAGYDINGLWIDSGFNPELFAYTIKRLHPLRIFS